jgi:hypothetical protein
VQPIAKKCLTGRHDRLAPGLVGQQRGDDSRELFQLGLHEMHRRLVRQRIGERFRHQRRTGRGRVHPAERGAVARRPVDIEHHANAPQQRLPLGVMQPLVNDVKWKRRCPLDLVQDPPAAEAAGRQPAQEEDRNIARAGVRIHALSAHRRVVSVRHDARRHAGALGPFGFVAACHHHFVESVRARLELRQVPRAFASNRRALLDAQERTLHFGQASALADHQREIQGAPCDCVQAPARRNPPRQRPRASMSHALVWRQPLPVPENPMRPSRAPPQVGKHPGSRWRREP